MSMRLLLLCPGQGGQHCAMFDMARSHPSGAALLASAALPGMGADWHANRHAQPLVVAATLAMWAALADAAPPPALVAGYSIGELSAWSVAGALGAADAVALAAQRAALMDACAAAEHAMLAFTGLSCARAAAIAAALGGDLAIRNGENSGVFGLPAAQADALSAALAAQGANVTRLPVAVASHTPSMAAAVQPFAAALAASALRDAHCPVLSGTSGARLEQRTQAIEHLPRQLAQTIDWDACMDACVEAGITVALELGPGNALARMLHARYPHIACRSVADFRRIDGIRNWLERHG